MDTGTEGYLQSEETALQAEGSAVQSEGTSAQADWDGCVRRLIAEHITVASMESCTGGLLASHITDTEGSSAVFKGGFVTYSNESKIRAGVPEEIIREYGVYSAPVAKAMARACKDECRADIGIGVTGTAGNPDPENEDSNPGEVYFAILTDDRECISRLRLDTEGMTRRAFKERVTSEIASALGELLAQME